MKIIMAVHADGGMIKCGIVPNEFDVQAWAESRPAAFRLLNIVRLEIIPLT